MADDDTTTLDEVFRELASVRAAYEDATDPGERLELEARLGELRQRAASLPETGLESMDDDELVHAVHNLRERVKAVRDSRLSPGAIQGSGGGGDGIGIDPYQWMKLNRAIEEGQGYDELRARLAVLEAELERRRAGGS